MVRLRITLLLLLLAVAVSCQTTRQITSTTTGEVVVPPDFFEPRDFVAAMGQGEGRYPDLYARSSYAVWVSPEVIALKRQQAVANGEPIMPWIENAAAVISPDYVVIECHVSSTFSDAAIAYDAVSFRNVDVYLQLPDGRIVRPVQVAVDPRMEETPAGTLKTFSRTNLVIFTRKDILAGTTTIPADTPSVRLVIEHVESTFHFDWGSSVSTPQGWTPTAEEALQAAKLGMHDLFTRLKTLAHMFD